MMEVLDLQRRKSLRWVGAFPSRVGGCSDQVPNRFFLGQIWASRTLTEVAKQRRDFWTLWYPVPKFA